MADVYGLTTEQVARVKRDRDRIAALEKRSGQQRVPMRWPLDNNIRPCVIVLEGGNPGGATPSDLCTFTYTVKTADGVETLLTAQTPLNPPRTPGVRMKQPAGGNLRGEMTIWEGTLKLWNAFEVPDFAPCSTTATADSPAQPGRLAKLFGFGGAR